MDVNELDKWVKPFQSNILSTREKQPLIQSCCWTNSTFLMKFTVSEWKLKQLVEKLKMIMKDRTGKDYNAALYSAWRSKE